MIPKRRPFTLLEIALCFAILSIAAGAIGWQFKTVFEAHKFNRHIDLLLTDLRRLQVVALAHEVDIEVTLKKEEGEFGYSIGYDEPNLINPKPAEFIGLKGVRAIKEGTFPRESHTLHITRDGRIFPATILGLYPASEKRLPLHLDLRYHPKLQAITTELN